jgi:hypothetical protein
MAPQILIESLETVRRRVRLLAVLFGVGLVAAAAVGLLLTTVLADYLLNLQAVPRLMLIVLALLGVGYALWHWIIKSIMARLTLNDVAGRVEKTFPQYQDRLRSTIDILSGHPFPGSEIMKQRVVSEATRLTQSLDLNRVVVARPVWYSSSLGVAAILLLALLIGTMGPQYRRVAMDRLFTPFSAVEWPKSVNIEMVGKLPARVSVGQRMEISIRLSKGDRANRKAIIHYQYGDESGTHFGPDEQEIMTRGDDGVYHASLDARTPADAAMGTVKIWTEAGDDRMDFKPVTVVQRLTISRVEAVITAPPYAKLPPVRVNLSQNPVKITEGSTVQLMAQFNKPLDPDRPVTVELLSSATKDGAKPVFKWNPPAGNVITADVDAPQSFRFHLHAVDVDGLSNTAAEEFEIDVNPDQIPTIVIDNPRRNEDRTPTAIVPMQMTAEDDFGIQSLKLVVDRVADKKHWEIPLVENATAVAGTEWKRVDSNNDLQWFRANYTWELAALKDANLKPGDVLEYRAVVRDNFELNGKTHAPVPSGTLRIVIISQEEFANKVNDILSGVAEQITTLKAAQNTTQKQTEQLAKDTAGKPALDKADQAAINRLAGQQSSLATQTNSLAGKLEDLQNRMAENKFDNKDLKDTAKNVEDLLKNVAENPMKNAAGALDKSREEAGKDSRNGDMKDATDSQAKAAEDLQTALNKMGGIGSLSRSIEKVEALLKDQQDLSAATAENGKKNLGKSTDQMSPEDKAKLTEEAKEQTDLEQRTAKALDEIAKDAQKLSKSDPAGAKAMDQAANTAGQQNVTGNQSKAADATKDNQQSQAQSAQKQAELGLQMMLADLKEAEKRKLDELAKKLAELQQQVAILIRQQAGFNLDNLNLQGPAAIAKISDSVKLDLFIKAERDPKLPLPPIELGMLSAGQEQTERNTRDIAKTAEDMPDGAGPADHLTRAADKMERAIVYLRDSKLADAYSPPQTGALTELLEAKKQIDEQKKKADQKQDDQKKEAIRQAYMALLASQNEVDARTIAIDATPKDEDGNLPREALVKLGQLPGEQGQIADNAIRIGDDVKSLGSVVYSYANDEIVRSMKQVKDQLGKKQTGVVTQAQQKQIVAELEAIIADLATKPEESQFAQQSQSGGGGGGGGNQGMPSEAEFRLLKSLQEAENVATTTIARAAKQEKSDLASLGDRQGSLRSLLDKLIQKASGGKAKLPPEPDNRDQLPEEAAGKPVDPNAVAQKVDDQELDNSLLGGDKPAKAGATGAAKEDGGQKDLDLVGDRMARAKQRLSMNGDAGPVTQEIQKRILDNLDDLIEQARKKEAQAQNTPPKPGGDPQQQQSPKPDPGAQPQDAQAQGKEQKPGQPQAQAGTSSGGGDGAKGDPAADIARQEAKQWGTVTPRERDAVQEGKNEIILEKYKNLVEDYYRTMSTKAAPQ